MQIYELGLRPCLLEKLEPDENEEPDNRQDLPTINKFETHITKAIDLKQGKEMLKLSLKAEGAPL